MAGMKNLNDEASLKDTEEKEQLQIEGNPEPDADPKPAGEINLPKDQVIQKLGNNS